MSFKVKRSTSAQRLHQSAFVRVIIERGDSLTQSLFLQGGAGKKMKEQNTKTKNDDNLERQTDKEEIRLKDSCKQTPLLSLCHVHRHCNRIQTFTWKDRELEWPYAYCLVMAMMGFLWTLHDITDKKGFHLRPTNNNLTHCTMNVTHRGHSEWDYTWISDYIHLHLRSADWEMCYG